MPPITSKAVSPCVPCKIVPFCKQPEVLLVETENVKDVAVLILTTTTIRKIVDLGYGGEL